MNNQQQIDIRKDADGNIFSSGDRNINVLGNLVIYTTHREQDPEQRSLAVDIGPNPYKGLSAFTENDQERFFGRERLIEELWQKFSRLYERSLSYTPMDEEGAKGESARLLAILGPSGSGKSSVARAGLLPELDRRPLAERQKVRVAVFQPGIRPFETLANILGRIAYHDQVPLEKSDEFIRFMRKANDRGQWAGLRRIVDALPGVHESPLILLIDQFEEVYSCEESEDCAKFIKNLLHAVKDRSGHVSVILTLRSDFLGHTQQHPDFNHLICDQLHNAIVPVMNDEELYKAIAKPAELAGHPLPEETIRLLIAQTEGREGALPLLQFALTQIWEGMTQGVEPAATLKDIGGVGGALANTAQQIYDRLNDAEKLIARRAFLQMIQLGEGIQDTRRRVLISNIVAQGEASQHVHEVLQRFSQQNARLITLSAKEDRKNMAEVTHEALITNWNTLQDWLETSRDDLRFHRRLADAARHWDMNARADGLLWRLPDLDLLQEFYTRLGCDMTPLEHEFCQASAIRQEREVAEQEAQRRKELEVQRQIAQEAERRVCISTAQSLVAYAHQKHAEEDREYAALLARQAYFIYQTYTKTGEEYVSKQIEDVLRLILHPLATETGPLGELVYQKLEHKLALTQEEWERAVGKEFPHQPRPCFEEHNIKAAAPVRLRHERIVTEDRLALSLNLNRDGYPKSYIGNEFEQRFDKQKQVILDRATGLMWQNADLPGRALTYKAAKAYVETLNEKTFAGHEDWRLPTIPELIFLLEEEKQKNDLYLDPLFELEAETRESYWVWSCDFYRTKGERSSGSAWGVYFNYGGVYWIDVEDGYYVRVVRS